MLKKIINFSINNKLLIGIVTLILIAVGVYNVTKLPIDAVPDITDNQVQVITIAPSYGAIDIERLVTFPIEQANSNISGIKEIRSFSRFGLSLVTIVFNDNIDIYWARQQIAERLQTIRSQIPEEIGNPELGPISTGLSEVYQYVVRAEDAYKHKYSITDLRTIQDWIIRRQILGLDGIAEVSSFGGNLKQYEIAVDVNKLNAHQITIFDVFNALKSNNQNTGGAYIEKGPTVLYIRSEGLITEIEDLGNITINSKNGNSLYIRDIAKINIGHATRYGALTYNDEGEAVGGIVMMLKGENSSKVIKNIKNRVEQIKQTLPKGITIEPFLDRTKMVNNAIQTVEKNLLEGALIVIFVLILFLGNIRAGLIVASVIPLAMLFTVILMNLFNVSGNLMSLGALDFGLIIDGAVIIVEATMHQLTHSKKYKNLVSINQHDMDNIVDESASKMMNSAVFGQIIILIVYLPIFTLSGIEGKMFKPMAQTVAFALLGAFILSLTYIPMMSALFLDKKIKTKKNISDKLIEILEKYYQKSLDKVLHYPKAALLSVIILFVFSIFILTKLGGEFIPELEEGDFAVDTRVLTGSNINTTIEYTQKAAHVLLKNFPEIEKIVTKIGSGEVPTDPMPMEASDMMVILKDKKDWTSAKNFNELADKMSEKLKDVPGITAGFQFPVQMRFNELMTGARQDVVCKIFGDNLDTLAHYAKIIGNVAKEIDGTQNIYVENITGLPQITIKYNRAALAQYQLNVSEINTLVNMALAGQSAGMLYEDEKRFDIVVKLDQSNRQSLMDIQQILIPTPSGAQIPLGNVAQVEVINGPNQIQREDAKRRIIVGFNIKDRDVQNIVSDLQTKIKEKVKLPSGYYITYGGSFENLNQAKSRLMIAVPVSLLLIFVLLYFAFNSVKQGILIYSAIPLSTIGGILFLALRGMPFSISAGIGFIALFGVAVLNGIVLIAEFNQLKNEGMKDVRRIVLMGTKVRLRPVLMTAFVASLGFLPMAISNSSGAEVQRPLATVVIGGLMIATFLTLYILPILYIISENKLDFSAKNNTSIQGIILIFILFFLNTNSNAQTNISLKEALDKVSNNHILLHEQDKSEYLKALINSGIEIPKANLSTEFGQINSVYFDTKFGISQTFAMPKFYKNQKEVQNQEWKKSELDLVVQKKEVEKEIALIFYEYLNTNKKIEMLKKMDSIYSKYLERVNIRWANGETNILEKTTAEIIKYRIVNDLNDATTSLNYLLFQFNFYLGNNSIVFLPYDKNIQFSFSIPIDTTFVSKHQLVQSALYEKNIAQAQKQLDKSKLLPEFTLGVNNMSIKGTGANDQYYSYKYRFTSGTFAIGLPFFSKSIKNKIASYKTLENSIDSKINYFKSEILLQYNFHWQAYNNQISKIKNYENDIQSKLKTIETVANNQLINGEINYLEWTLLIQQTIDVQNLYFDYISKSNQHAIQLYFLTNQN